MVKWFGCGETWVLGESLGDRQMKTVLDIGFYFDCEVGIYGLNIHSCSLSKPVVRMCLVLVLRYIIPPPFVGSQQYPGADML